MSKNLNKALKSFVTSWSSSVTSRLRACRIYADAVNTKDLDAKYQFRALPAFKNWSPKQWRLIELIGSGVVSPCYLDYKHPGIPISLANNNVGIEQQEFIFENGLQLADMAGNVKRVALKNLQDHHVCQAFKPDGTPRTVEEQIAWLKAHEHDNIVVFDNGVIRIRHACHITPEQLFSILTGDCAPLGAEALMAAAAKLAGRR